jgi:hypothetical protein
VLDDCDQIAPLRSVHGNCSSNYHQMFMQHRGPNTNMCSALINSA